MAITIAKSRLCNRWLMRQVPAAPASPINSSTSDSANTKIPRRPAVNWLIIAKAVSPYKGVSAGIGGDQPEAARIGFRNDH